MNIVSRAAWGARAPKSVAQTKATKNLLHHAGGEGFGAPRIRGIQNFHMDTRGMVDVAYNFLIDPTDYKVYEGRGWNVRPGSQYNLRDSAGKLIKDYNVNTWSVCVLGDFRTRKPDNKLLETVAGLINLGADLGHIPRSLYGGHQDWTGRATTCPGNNLYPAIPLIRQLLEEQDMPLNDADLKAIKDTLVDVLGGGRITMPKAGDTFDRFGNLGIVNSVWHATSGNTKLANVLASAQAYAKQAAGALDPAQIADAIIADMGTDLAGKVVDEISARLSL